MELDQAKVAIDKSMKIKNKYINRKTIPYLIGYGVSILLMLALSFIANPEFSFEQLKTWAWWMPNVVCSICIILVLITRLKEGISTRKERDEDINEINKALFERVKASKFNSNQLQAYIVSQNRLEKRRVYISNIENEIARLNNSPLTTAKALRKWRDGDKNTHYGRVREKLEQQLNEDYINRSIDYLNVTYKEWTYPAVMAGIQQDKESGNWITENEFVAKHAVKKAFSRIVMVVAFSSIGGTLDFTNLYAFADMILKIFSVISTLLAADQLAETYVNVNVKGFAYGRLDFFKKFEETQRVLDEQKVLEEQKIKEEAEIAKEKISEPIKVNVIQLQQGGV